jgi:hypothetical protein
MDKQPLQIAYGAICAICTAAVIQLSAFGPLDWPLSISVGCFAIAIPFLATLFYVPLPHTRAPTALSRTQRVYHTISLVAPRLALFGLAALFFHFGWLFGLLFAASALLGYTNSLEFSARLFLA